MPLVLVQSPVQGQRPPTSDEPPWIQGIEADSQGIEDIKCDLHRRPPQVWIRFHVVSDGLL
ncbi:hypothetical protein [Thiocapsa sp. C4-3m]|uniref:hypothetical protein n=1 Tax=Thiocapsa sp. C4-3m TaxID=3137393 RepID=UPI0035AD95A9